jgi:aryl carrier-like protein
MLCCPYVSRLIAEKGGAFTDVQRLVRRNLDSIGTLNLWRREQTGHFALAVETVYSHLEDR